MNKIKLAVILFLFTPFIINSQNLQPTIEVTGTAEIKIEADMMELSININVDDDDLISAKNQNDESTKKVLAVLKRLNIEDKDIVTSGIKMFKQHDTYKKNIHYSVTNSVSLKTSNISGYEEITTELIRINNVYISNTVLSSTKAIETRVKAREEALVAAKKKAEYMAAVLNMSVGKPVLINENTNSYYPNTFNNVTQNVIDPNMDYGSDLFKAGLISISASVKVIFNLIDK